MRFHERTLNIQWKQGVKRADKSNAIDMLCSGQIPRTPEEKAEYERVFEAVPEPFTTEEREQWLAKLTNVALSSDAFFPFIDNVFRAQRSGVKYIAAPTGSQNDVPVFETAEKLGITFGMKYKKDDDGDDEDADMDGSDGKPLTDRTETNRAEEDEDHDTSTHGYAGDPVLDERVCRRLEEEEEEEKEHVSMEEEECGRVLELQTVPLSSHCQSQPKSKHMTIPYDIEYNLHRCEQPQRLWSIRRASQRWTGPE
ncbi:hypothetical protein KEM56_004931 [Ascosphaera pollenicola]|nr:hypothetical protein KEM56_004931 [Ascosphaera pollenicola]